METDMKKQLYSALNTFITTFLSTLAVSLMAIDLSEADKAVYISLGISALNVALRAATKVIFFDK